MQTLAIYFTDRRKNGYPFDTREYRRAYFDLTIALRRKGLRVVIVRGPESYVGRGKFQNGFEFGADATTLVNVSAFTADAIFDRGYGASIFSRERHARVLNASALDRICTDKWRTYRTFPDDSPKTVLLKKAADTKKLTRTFGNATIISKPLDGQDGRDIFVGNISELNKCAARKTYPQIVQQFIDFSHGMPGVCRVRHELRTYISDGRITSAYVALILNPKVKTASLAESAIIRRAVSLAKIPPAIRALARRVDRKLQSYRPRLYALDIGWDAVTNRPYIIELNSRVGLPQPEYSWYRNMLAAFATFLIRGTRASKITKLRK